MLSVIVLTQPFVCWLACNETGEGRLNNAVGPTRNHRGILHRLKQKKVNLSLCLVKHQAQTIAWGSVDMGPTFLTSESHVSGQLNALAALSLRKETAVPIG
jgi:hypothetical protein